MLKGKLVQSQPGIRLDAAQELPGLVGFLLTSEGKRCKNNSMHAGRQRGLAYLPDNKRQTCLRHTRKIARDRCA